MLKSHFYGVPFLGFSSKERDGNEFLISIIKKCENVRMSHRYQGYLRIRCDEYRMVLYRSILEDMEYLGYYVHIKKTFSKIKLPILKKFYERFNYEK